MTRKIEGAGGPLPAHRPGWWQVARHGACPACGMPGTAFAELTLVAPTCRACGTALAEHEATGRALYPVILPLIVLLVLGSLWVDAHLALPMWVQGLAWLLVIPLVVGGAVRGMKAAWLLARVPGGAR